MSRERVYHILIDRFFPQREPDPAGNFRGGCLRSVADHLDYVRGLGMTGILLTPFYKTAAYHGYHIVDYRQVDPHFGTWDDVARLVHEAHRRGMTIAADFVAGHCHRINPLFADGRHAGWFLHGRDGRPLGYAGLDELPRFDTDNGDVRAYLAERAIGLGRMGFDALRLDHATGPTYAFWDSFVAALGRACPGLRLVGEVWGAMDFRPRRRLRYALHRLRYGAQEARQLEYADVFDGVLDFRYQQLLCAAAHKGRIAGNRRLRREVERHLARYPTRCRPWLFLDNHDLNRFLFECGGRRSLLDEAAAFTGQWQCPSLTFYATERAFANTKDIFDGTPYADERVRPCLREASVNVES